MAQSKHQIQSLLAEAGIRPRQRFGQNFMIDQNLVRLVVEAGQIAPEDLVIEVGAGTGTLTEELLTRCAHVIAVEIDRDLARLLRERLGSADIPTFLRMLEYSAGRDILTFSRMLEYPRLLVIEGDALSGKHGLNPQLRQAIAAARRAGRLVKLVANLPYNIASPLIIELLIAGVELLAFTVQKEVADRLRAAPGTEQYGALSVMTQLLARVELLRRLPPQAFWPVPKVDSALARLTRDDRLGDRAREFSRFVQQLFSSRRKTIRNALVKAGYDADHFLQSHRIDPRLRPEMFSPQQLLDLFDALWSLREE